MRSENHQDFFEIFTKKSLKSNFGTIESSVLNNLRKTENLTEIYFIAKILEPYCSKKVALLYGSFSQYLVNKFLFCFLLHIE